MTLQNLARYHLGVLDYLQRRNGADFEITNLSLQQRAVKELESEGDLNEN